jgi:hypothetical protein
LNTIKQTFSSKNNNVIAVATIIMTLEIRTDGNSGGLDLEKFIRGLWVFTAKNKSLVKQVPPPLASLQPYGESQ